MQNRQGGSAQIIIGKIHGENAKNRKRKTNRPKLQLLNLKNYSSNTLEQSYQSKNNLFDSEIKIQKFPFYE
jgi:hypothetical protein